MFFLFLMVVHPYPFLFTQFMSFFKIIFFQFELSYSFFTYFFYLYLLSSLIFLYIYCNLLFFFMTNIYSNCLSNNCLSFLKSVLPALPLLFNHVFPLFLYYVNSLSPYLSVLQLYTSFLTLFDLTFDVET